MQVAAAPIPPAEGLWSDVEQAFFASAPPDDPEPPPPPHSFDDLDDDAASPARRQRGLQRIAGLFRPAPFRKTTP